MDDNKETALSLLRQATKERSYRERDEKLDRARTYAIIALVDVAERIAGLVWELSNPGGD